MKYKLDFTSKEIPRLQKAPRKPVRIVQRTACIYIGTTACRIGSRMIKLLDAQNTSSFVQHLALDTDDAGRAGSTNGYPFNGTQYHKISLDRVSTITNHPDRHASLVNQVGLDDQEALVFLRQLSDNKQIHAGQVRPMGYLGFMADILGIRNSIVHMINELTAVDSPISVNLDHKNSSAEINSKLVFVLVYSIAGATGSSMAMAIASMIRELTKNLRNVEIHAYMLAPTTFDSVLDSKPLQLKRVYANGYRTIQEIESARSGLLEQHDVKISIGDDSFGIPPDVFSQIYVIGDMTATGHRLPGPKEIGDTVACYLSGLLGTELSNRIESDVQNDHTCARMERDPITKRARHIGTIGARCLAIGKERIKRHLAAQLIAEVYDHLKNRGYEKHEMESHCISGLNQVKTVLPEIAKLLVPSRLILCRDLYNLSSKTPFHFTNSVFLERFKNVRLGWRQKTSRLIQDEIRKMVAERTVALTTFLDGTITKIGESKGLEGQRQFIELFASHLKSLGDELQKESTAELAASKRLTEKLDDELKALEGTFAWMISSKSSQEAAITSFHEACSVAIRGAIKDSCFRMMIQDLQNRVTAWRDDIHRKIETYSARKSMALDILASTRAGQAITTDSNAEVDLGSEGLDEKLFLSKAPTADDFLHRFATESQTTPTDIKRILLGDESAFHTAIEFAQRIFAERLETLSIVDILADLLADEHTSNEARSLLQHVLGTAQPLWDSESGQLHLTYADMILVGLPPALNEGKRRVVLETIRSIDPSKLRADGQYNGRLDIVDTGDNDRIYVLRRCTGAQWHYFGWVRKAKAFLTTWESMGGANTSIFNKKLVDQMESLIPEPNDNQNELAMALGLAYGWVATRASHLYDNLVYSDETKKWVVRLSSSWNGVAFHGSQLRADSSKSVMSIMESGKMVYEAKKEPEKSARIGQGFQEAWDTVIHNREITEKMMDAFELVRITAGDLVVIQDLEGYIVELRARAKPKDANYGLVLRMIDRISSLIAQLRAENA